MTNRFGPSSPILRVAQVGASLAYYVQKLGFKQDWGESGMVSVSRDGCTLFLSEWDQGRSRTWVWVGVEDAEALHRELVARGATIRSPPTNFAWALELQVEDLDGNVLRLGSDPNPDVPYGEFLDASRVLWSTGPGNGTETPQGASPEPSNAGSSPQGPPFAPFTP